MRVSGTDPELQASILTSAELSDVLWSMVLEGGRKSAIMMYVCFFFWFSATIGILIFMEGLSAFLHALRLHW